MRAKFLTVISTAACLASCAGDNPENVPLYGQWDMTTRVTSLTVDGMAVPPADYPPQFKQLGKSEQRCGEPMFIDRDWQQQDINRQVQGDCTLTSYDVTPTRVTGKGQCMLNLPDADFNPALDILVNQAADNFRMQITITGAANIQGQGRHVISATAVQDGRRSGDC